jgi:broad specificity phosphatase PhoE
LQSITTAAILGRVTARHSALRLAGPLAVLLAASSCASYSAGVSSGGFGVGAATSTRPGAAATTTIYVVRHAEARQDSTRDPALTEDGRHRADELRDLLRSKGITAIYASPYRRTQATAAPLAETLGLEVETYDPNDTRGLATAILGRHPYANVLVVGHSNTVPLIVEALGGVRPADLAHTEHDPLFIVRIQNRQARVERERYGAASDTTVAR